MAAVGLWRFTLNALQRGEHRRGATLTVRETSREFAKLSADPAWKGVRIGAVVVQDAITVAHDVKGIVDAFARAVSDLHGHASRLDDDGRAVLHEVLQARTSIGDTLGAATELLENAAEGKRAREGGGDKPAAPKRTRGARKHASADEDDAALDAAALEAAAKAEADRKAIEEAEAAAKAAASKASGGAPSPEDLGDAPGSATPQGATPDTDKKTALKP